MIVRDCQQGKISSGLEEGFLQTPELDAPLTPPGLIASSVSSSHFAVSGEGALSTEQSHGHSAEKKDSEASSVDKREGPQKGDIAAGKSGGYGALAEGVETVQVSGGAHHKLSDESSDAAGDGAVRLIGDQGGGAPPKDEIDSLAAVDAIHADIDEGNAWGTNREVDTLQSSWRPLVLGMGLKLLQEVSEIVLFPLHPFAPFHPMFCQKGPPKSCVVGELAAPSTGNWLETASGGERSGKSPSLLSTSTGLSFAPAPVFLGTFTAGLKPQAVEAETGGHGLLWWARNSVRRRVQRRLIVLHLFMDAFKVKNAARNVLCVVESKPQLVRSRLVELVAFDAWERLRIAARSERSCVLRSHLSFFWTRMQ